MSLSHLAPIPNLLNAKRVLYMQPHPDDVDIACGGTLAVLADRGAHITYLTVTDGGAGSSVRRDENQLANVRRLEQIAAGRYIGVQDYIWLNYRDAEYLPGQQLQHDFIRAIRQVRPDTVVTIDGWLPYEAHPAHRNVGLSAAAATLSVPWATLGTATSCSHTACSASHLGSRQNPTRLWTSRKRGSEK